MNTAGIVYKDHIPSFPFAIERPTLLARMQGALDHKLTLLSAPPGYGKTTIASQFAAQASCQVIWHSVEERERDFPNLVEHALSVFAPVIGDLKTQIPYPNHVSPGDIAVRIADALREAGGVDLIYVLDDVHYLDGMSSGEAWLRALYKRLPLHCHIIVISRTLPDLPYTDMAMRHELLAFGLSDLRLTGDEIDTMAGAMASPRISVSRRQRLIARLDGWPAGVSLALQPLPSHVAGVMSDEESEPETLFARLASAMLREQPPDLQQFLLDSSTLRLLTAERCANMLSLAGGAELLETAARANLFLSRVPGGLVYHNLFRDFLQREQRDRSPGRYRALHLMAAEWLATSDDIEEAFVHFIAAGRPARAVQIADRAAVAYFGLGKFETLLDWCVQLRRLDQVAPMLFATCAMIHIDRYQYDLAERNLQLAERGFSRAGDEYGSALVVLSRAMIELQRGNFQQALALAEGISLPDDDGLKGRAMRIAGFAHLRLGDARKAVGYLEDAARHFRAAGMVSSLSHLLQDLQFAYMRLGQLDDMGRCLQEVVALRRSLGGASGLALALTSLGYYYHKRSNYMEALATFEEGQRLIANSYDPRTEGYLLASLADLKRDLGMFATAEQLYNQAQRLVKPQSEPSLYIAILLGLATLHRWQSKLKDAQVITAVALDIATQHQLPFEMAMAEAACLRSQPVVDDSAVVWIRLDGIVENLMRQGADFELLEVLGCCLSLANEFNDAKAASQYQKLADQLARKVGTAQPLAAESTYTRQMDGQIARPSGSLLLAEDLRKLVEAQKKVDERAGVATWSGSALSSGLRIVTLGHEAVERDGSPLAASDWQAAPAREMFLNLFFNGAKSRAEMELLFWPDSYSEQARQSFHTALHRARQALGSDAILLENEIYRINPDLPIECDAHQLESFVLQARLLSPRDARADDLWHKAVLLYQGEFLPSLESLWVIGRRETYHSFQIEALSGMGKCARARGDLKRASEWFSAAIGADPYSEENYRHVMMCYSEMGEPAKVWQSFEDLKSTLKADLGIQPSQETANLADRLLGKT